MTPRQPVTLLLHSLFQVWDKLIHKFPPFSARPGPFQITANQLITHSNYSAANYFPTAFFVDSLSQHYITKF